MIYDIIKIWRKRLTDSVNESVNDEAVYRTAPATPGLLNTTIRLSHNAVNRRLYMKVDWPCWLMIWVTMGLVECAVGIGGKRMQGMLCVVGIGRRSRSCYAFRSGWGYADIWKHYPALTDEDVLPNSPTGSSQWSRLEAAEKRGWPGVNSWQNILSLISRLAAGRDCSTNTIVND